MTTDICMILNKSITHDARVIREASSLGGKWAVTVVSIAVEEKNPSGRQPDRNFRVKWINPQFAKRLFPGTYGKILRLLLSLPTTIYELHKQEATLYHAHDLPSLLIAFLAFIPWNRIVYDSHELYFEMWTKDLKYPPKHVIRLLRPLEKTMARRAAGVITASDSYADFLAERLDIERPCVIRNVTDLRMLGASPADIGDDDHQVVIHSGGLFIARNLHNMIAAFAHLPAGIDLVLLGDGSLRSDLEKHIDRLSLRDRVRIIPPVLPENVVPTVAQADAAAVLISTDMGSLSFAYSLPNKVCEAVAAQVPVVASPTVEVARIVRQYDIGEFCDATDPKDIARAILSVLEPARNAHYRRNMVKAAANLNWEREEVKLVAFYDRLLGV